MAKCMMPSWRVTATMNFNKNCSPLPFSESVGVPYTMTHLSTNTVATIADATLATGMALVSFAQLSIKTNSFWLPDFVFREGPRMFIVRNRNSPEAENRPVCF